MLIFLLYMCIHIRKFRLQAMLAAKSLLCKEGSGFCVLLRAFSSKSHLLEGHCSKIHDPWCCQADKNSKNPRPTICELDGVEQKEIGHAGLPANQIPVGASDLTLATRREALFPGGMPFASLRDSFSDDRQLARFQGEPTPRPLLFGRRPPKRPRPTRGLGPPQR